MTKLTGILPFIITLSLMASCSPANGGARTKWMVVKVDGRKIRVEVVADRTSRTRGLMYRTKLRKNEGMLFVFPDSRRRAFWMKNTMIPLDIGYFDERGVLLEYMSMAVQKNTPDAQMRSYFSSGPAKYALEMNVGWFKRNKIRKKARLELPRRIVATP